MSYLQKFNRLKDILQHDFSQRYGKNRPAEDEKGVHSQTIRLMTDLDKISNDLKARRVTERAAYLTLLSRCTGLPNKAVQASAESERLLAERCQTLLADATYQPDDNAGVQQEIPLVSDEEKKLVYVSSNAVSIVPLEKLTAVSQEVYKNGMELSDASWLIAVALYEEYRKRKSLFWNKRKDVIEGILLGFLRNQTSDFMAFRKTVTPQLAPFSVEDFLFYQMTHVAIPAAPGPHADTIWEDIQALKVRHDPAHAVAVAVNVPAPANRFSADIIFRRENIKPPESYDLYLKHESDTFLEELNKLYRALTDPADIARLKNFVNKLNVLDVKVRNMQAKMYSFDSLRSQPDLQGAFAKPLEKEVWALRQQIEQDVVILKQQAALLFYQGQPSDLTRRIIGIGCLVIFGIVLSLSVLTLTLMPPAAFTVAPGGLLLTNKILAITSTVASSIGMGGGGITLFKSREIKPAIISSVAGNMISFIEKKGLTACAKISEKNNEHQYVGVSRLFQ